jgi:hypothetical protein
MKTTIDQIHESIINGQGKQAVKQIEEYGVYDFFMGSYDSYLQGLYVEEKPVNEYQVKAARLFIGKKYR